MTVPVHIGCCGFRRTRKEYYRSFEAVEVQHTFYDPPSPQTLASWRSEVSSSFAFSMKAWLVITHAGDSPAYRRLRTPLPPEELALCGYFRPTSTVRAALERTLECAIALAARSVVFQCPPRFTPSEEHVSNLRSFFSLPRPLNVLYGWEPRGDWPDPLVKELCEELNLIHVVDPLQRSTTTTNAYYYRVMGRTGRSNTLTDEELNELSSKIDGERESYVFFNHLAMLEDAARFQRIVREISERNEFFNGSEEKSRVNSQ